MGEGRVLFVGNETLQVIEENKVAAGITRGALFRRVLKGGKATTARLTPEAVREIVEKQSQVFRGVKGACIWSFAPGEVRRCRWLVGMRRWWRCKWMAVGRIHECQATMPARSSLRIVQLHGLSMVRGSEILITHNSCIR